MVHHSHSESHLVTFHSYDAPDRDESTSHPHHTRPIPMKSIPSQSTSISSRIHHIFQTYHKSIKHILKGFDHHDADNATHVAMSVPLPIIILLVIISIIIGVTLVVQVGANTRCGHVLGMEMRGSFIHFSVMAILTGLIQIHHLPSWMPLFRSSFSHPTFRLWHLTGGVWGAVFVTVSIVLVEQIGFALYFVASVAGQVGTSLILDTIGFMGYRKIPLRKMKILGVVLTVVGCILLQDYSSTGDPVKTVLLTLVSVIAGAIPPFDAAVNNAYALLIRNPMAVAWISFIVGSVCLAGLYLITLAFHPFTFDSELHVWWQWTGGALGAIFIISALYIPPVIGVATFFVSLVCGQLMFSMISDQYGIFGPIREATILSIIGIIVAFAGAVLVSLEHTKNEQQHSHQHQHQHSHPHIDGQSMVPVAVVPTIAAEATEIAEMKTTIQEQQQLTSHIPTSISTTSLDEQIVQ